MQINFLEWIWTVPMAVMGGSYEVRLRSKVGKGECDALHNGLVNQFKDMKTHVDQRFDDWKDFYMKQSNKVMKEIKKANNGG